MKTQTKNGLLLLAATLSTLTPAPRFDNALGTLSGTLILQKALDIVFTKRPLLKTISLGFRDLDGRVENALKGQNVTSRILSVPAVADFGSAAADREDSDVTVSLTGFKQVYYKFTAAQYNATDRDLINESAEPLAIAIANHIIDAVGALWLQANFSREIVVASAWDYDNTLRALKKDLDDHGVLDANRFFIPNSAVHDSLLGDSMVVTALNNPANGEAIRTGKLPMVAGLGIEQYNQLPANGETLVGVAGTPDSTVYVARAPKNPTEMAPNLAFPGVIGYIEEPKTGFKIMVNQWIDPTDLSVNNRLVWLEGFAKGNPNNLTRLVTTSNA